MPLIVVGFNDNITCRCTCSFLSFQVGPSSASHLTIPCLARAFLTVPFLRYQRFKDLYCVRIRIELTAGFAVKIKI